MTVGLQDAPEPDTAGIGTPPGVGAGGPVPAPTGRRSRRWWPVAATVACLAVGVPTTVILLQEDKPARIQLPLPDPDRLVGPDGSELASLLAKGRERTFHATYTLTAGDRRESLEWWSDGGRVRQDTTIASDAGPVRTASFKPKKGDDAVACRQDPGQAWACERVRAPLNGDPQGLVASIQAQLSGRAVAVRSDQVNGRAARCFSVAATPGSDAVELCSDPDGVLLRLASSDATLELATLEGAVPDDTFDPPAAP